MYNNSIGFEIFLSHKKIIFIFIKIKNKLKILTNLIAIKSIIIMKKKIIYSKNKCLIQYFSYYNSEYYLRFYAKVRIKKNINKLFIK